MVAIEDWVSLRLGDGSGETGCSFGAVVFRESHEKGLVSFLVFIIGACGGAG